MNINEVIQKLKTRLNEYSESEVYQLNNSARDIVNALMIAINLIELADRGSIEISENDKRWFEGKYQVSRNFDDPKWDEIGHLYSELADYAINKFFAK